MEETSPVDTALLVVNLVDLADQASKVADRGKKAGRKDLKDYLEGVETYCWEQATLLQMALDSDNPED